MKLHLLRPLAFIDLETTGVQVGSDRIVEISILKVSPDGSKDLKTKRIHPTIAIPVQSSNIHGIYDQDVKDAPTFKMVAQELLLFLASCDLAGFNSNKFDIPLLMEEFLRSGIEFDLTGRKWIDVQTIFHKKEPRNLSAAYKFYCQKDLKNAHSAEADIVATFEILESQLDRYPDLKNDVDYLHEISVQNSAADLAGMIVFNAEGIEVFNFGKHKGKSVVQVFASEPSYYKWIMDGDFPLYTKKVFTQLKLGKKENQH